MRKYNFTKIPVVLFVITCIISPIFNAQSQSAYKYRDNDIFVEYEPSNGIIGNLFINGSYLPTDTMLFFLGTTLGSSDLYFKSRALGGENSIGTFFPDSYGWYGYIGGENIVWNYLTIIIKREGQVFFKRVMPTLTLNLSEDSKFKHDKYFINSNSFLTNISTLPLDVVGYSLTGNILLKNVKLESQAGIKICEKCLLILSSPDGFVQKVKIF